MRRIVITGLALICVVTLGSLAATREPRSAVIDAVTRTPTQVEVTNFPAVQGVAGMVTVGNLPAVQNVMGAVAVNNLPLDADGNVRVAGQAAAPSYRWVRIANGVPVTSRDGITLGPIDVAGWRRADFHIFGGGTSVGGTAQYGSDGVFLNTPEGSFGSVTQFLFTTEVHGPQAQLSLGVAADTTVDAWVYLSN